MMRLRPIAALVILAVIAISPWSFAKSLDYLLQLAGKDALPEVREAAALALTPALVISNMGNEELRRLALQGASAELRSAAARALGTRLAQAAVDLDQLETLAASGEFPEVRAAASELLRQRLQQSGLSVEALARMAITGSSSELRMAAIPALTTALANSAYSNEELLAAASSGATVEYRLAAAQGLVLRLQNSRLFTLEQQALLEIVSGNIVRLSERVQGVNVQIRTAAAALFEEQLQQADWSLDQLQQLTEDAQVTPELRAAAGAVLSDELLNANLPLDDLQKLATGETPELRRAAIPALVQALVAAVGRRTISINTLVDSVAHAASEELAEAEAEAVFVLLRRTLVAPQAQSQVEAIANGQAVLINGLMIDGSLKAFRVAAGNFLVGIYTFFGFLDRLTDPLGELTAIAENTAFTEEFRAAAAQALVPVYLAQRGRATQDLATLNALLDQIWQAARQGQTGQALETLARFKALLSAERDLLIVTAEVGGEFTARQLLNDEVNRDIAQLERALQDGSIFTVNTSISDIRRAFDTIERGISRAPDVTTETLEQIASQGATPELRQAASQAWADRLWRDPPDVSILMQLASEGASAELRQAAVPALTASLISSGANFERLYSMALDGVTAEVRLASAQAIMQSSAMGNLPLETLQALANGQSIEIGSLVVDGSRIELRQAFTPALQEAFIAHNESDERLETWATHGATPELRQAAAEVLAERFAQPEGPSIDHLMELAISGTSEELRAGVARALTSRLIASDLTESDLFALIAVHTLLLSPNTSTALSHALALALADRFARDP